MIFASLLKTGIGMSFSRNSRPASGSEHIVAHLMECVELREGIIPNFHGEDVGVCTLEMLKYYNALADVPQIGAKRECVDWETVYAFYDNMADEVRALNEPDNVIDAVDPEKLRACWEEIAAIIHSVPGYEACRAAMEKAGCKTTVADIGKTQDFYDACFRYAPYMRRRLTLHRLCDMIVDA